MNKQEDAYQKISSNEDISQILYDVSKFRSSLNLWSTDDKDGFVAFPPDDLKPNKEIRLKVTSKNFKIQDWYQKEVTGSFHSRGPLYFFKSKIFKVEGTDEIFIDYPNLLFKLQRRQNFRVDIVSGDSFKVELHHKNTIIPQDSVEILDVSLGGLGIKLPLIFAMEMIPGDLIGPLKITFGKNKIAMNVKAEVRYKLLVDYKDGANTEKIGLKFEKLDPIIGQEFNLFINRLFREKQLLTFG